VEAAGQFNITDSSRKRQHEERVGKGERKKVNYRGVTRTWELNPSLPARNWELKTGCAPCTRPNVEQCALVGEAG
jgi:hypothetical protein